MYDHMAESYNILTSKYGEKTHFILASDSNKLKLSPILDISSSFTQVVKVPTRLDPPAILDTIVTSLSKFYNEPITKPPLQNDPDNLNGKPSDHLIVLWAPISCTIEDKARQYKTVTFRPIPDSGLSSFSKWLISYSWDKLYRLKTVDEKAELFHSILYEQVEHHFPEKSSKVSLDDKPWVTNDIKILDRRRKREFFKNFKSPKWQMLNEKYMKLVKKVKSSYAKNIVGDLKSSNHSQWYSKVKQMANVTSHFENQ